MHRRFQLIVRDAVQNVAKINNHLVVDGLYTPVFSVDQDLQTRISERREQSNETTVCVLWRRQLKCLPVELAAIDDTRTTR